MLECVDLDLNSVPNSSNSLKETLKQTMLNQEVVFRSQVFTLHQLYKMQIASMEDFKQKGLDNYYLHQRIPINLNYQSKSSKKHIDLQLSADEFINQCADDFSSKGFFSIFSDKVDTGVDYPNLSLSIGRDASKMDEKNRSWKGKKSSASSIDIIDLEDENLRVSKYEAYLGLASTTAASNSFSRQKHKLDSFLDRGKQKLESNRQIGFGSSYGNTLSRSIVDVGASCQTESLCNSGINRHHGSFMPANFSSENKISLNCKVNNIDLNKAQHEDLSYVSNDHSMVVNSSITRSSPVSEKFYRKSNVGSSVSPAWRMLIEMKDTQQNGMNFEDAGEKFGKDGKGREGIGAHISYVDLDPDSSEELCSERSDPKISSVGSSSKISNGLSCGMDLNEPVGDEENLEKDAEASSESECMTNHHSSSIKTTQSGVAGDDINFSTSEEREKIETCALAVHSGEQDVRSSDSTESNNQGIIRTNPEEADGRVQTAAELLVQMSFKPQTCCQDELSKIPFERFQNKEDERPQSSLESYEAMVLKAEEMSSDDYCVSSNAFLVDETEKKDISYKLKRGTRMRDFQKDILPSLSTLSSHEIREDVNILQGVIRSREYKRMRSKMADGAGDLCRSTRSKRSRVSRR